MKEKNIFKAQGEKGKMVTAKKFLLLYISGGRYVKIVTLVKTIKYGKIDTEGGNGIKRNPMRLLYPLHPEDCKIS